MPRNREKRSFATKLAVVPLVATAALVAFYIFQQLQSWGPQSSPDLPSLRLTGQQALLNWQSFPGRRVAVEFCTLGVSPEGRVICRILDGAREAGYIALDEETLDRATADWADSKCAAARAVRGCTVRVTGVLRKGRDGRPVLERALAHR